MDPAFAIAQRSATAISERGLNLGNDGKRDFLGRFRAQIESDWSVQFRENGGIESAAPVRQFREQLLSTLPRAEQPEIRKGQRQHCVQKRKVSPEVVRHDD